MIYELSGLPTNIERLRLLKTNMGFTCSTCPTLKTSPIPQKNVLNSKVAIKSEEWLEYQSGMFVRRGSGSSQNNVNTSQLESINQVTSFLFSNRVANALHKEKRFQSTSNSQTIF